MLVWYLGCRLCRHEQRAERRGYAPENGGVDTAAECALGLLRPMQQDTFSPATPPDRMDVMQESRQVVPKLKLPDAPSEMEDPCDS
ncbi:hypothetical protein J1614_005690 [Plenodomus biglobosus]|nr:hypothetical protein J1614_005690 [Plenodomus biglobosus]